MNATRIKPVKTRKTTARKATVKGAPAVVRRSEPEMRKKPSQKTEYFFAVGRRKSAVARVRIHKKGEGFLVNGKTLAEYFPTAKLQGIVKLPLAITGIAYGQITVKVLGGGVRGQAESVRHGIARALLLLDPQTRTSLKQAGLLTRDSRVKERKKYGLKRARRAPQWQKR